MDRLAIRTSRSESPHNRCKWQPAWLILDGIEGGAGKESEGRAQQREGRRGSEEAEENSVT